MYVSMFLALFLQAYLQQSSNFPSSEEEFHNLFQNLQL
jgi:hypothetical protein